MLGHWDTVALKAVGARRENWGHLDPGILGHLQGSGSFILGIFGM